MHDRQLQRRDFLRLFPVALPAALMGGRDAYQPAGHLHADDFSTFPLSRVLLDGRPVTRVFELDDVEGWLRRYSDDMHRIERHVGAVRVEWLYDQPMTDRCPTIWSPIEAPREAIS